MRDIQLPKEFLQDIMTTAVEGGIDYWAALRTLAFDMDGGIVRFDVRDCEDMTANWELIDCDRVNNAVNRILGGDVKIADAARTSVREAVDDPENAGCYIDADIADSIIQIAAYGEIVFS